MPSKGGAVTVLNLKELYLANSMDELRTKCDSELAKHGDGDKLVSSMGKMYKEAVDSFKRGDEERSYILFSRTAEIYKRLKISNKVDGRYLDSMFPVKNFKDTVEKLEQLDTSLLRRYGALQTVNERDKNNDSNNCSGDESQKQPLQQVHDLVTNNVITCTDLYKLICELRNKTQSGTSDDPSLLILDVRPSTEYAKSRIDKQKLKSPSLVVVNIPGENLTLGTSWKKIEQELPLQSKNLLKRRKTAKKVVILDHESQDKESATAQVTCVYDALWKWDTSADRCTGPPSVLHGGFAEWLLTYPQFTSDATYKVEEVKSAPLVIIHKINYEYEDDDDIEVAPSKRSSSSVSTNSASPLVNGTVNGLEDVDNKKSWTKPTPGGARPVTVPDRSTKPKPPPSSSSPVPQVTTKIDINQDFRKLKLDEETEEMDKKQIPKQIPKQIAKQIPRRSRSPTVPKPVDIPKPIDITPPPSPPEMKPRATERTLSESVPKNGLTMAQQPSGLGGLSRSYSSPNIAQLLEDTASVRAERRASVAVPRFDRSLKPSMLVSSNKPTKHRNFAPVYGSFAAKFPGLRNLGNTCFMSAVIQCLSSTVQLGQYFTSYYRQDINLESKFGSGGELAEELGELIRVMWSGQYKSLSPKDLKDAVGRHLPGFVGCDQQDSHEFLTMLLEKVHADLNTATENGPVTVDENLDTHLAINKFWKSHRTKNNSIISQIFEGLLLSTLECTVCGKKSDSFETFTCLSLPIPSGTRVTINDCFKLFSEYERMSGEAAWDCPTCKCKRDAVKRIQVCRLPRVMVIHLKRFSYEGMWRHKLTTTVDYPVSKLDVKNYMYANHGSSNTLYDLYGVVCHTGTMEGGHYVSLCKNPESSSWFKFDDHEVSEVSATHVKSNQSAYVLFYASPTINSNNNFINS